MSEAIKLHIGGIQAKEGWKILNTLPGPHVDILGSCTDLSIFADESVDEIYASHVLEHLDFRNLGLTLREIGRVTKPGGLLKVSVPDLTVLCRLYNEYPDGSDQQLSVMNMIYGGHVDEYDVHHFGFNFSMLGSILGQVGFTRLTRVTHLGEFDDTSNYSFNGVPISLNCIAVK